MPITVVSLPNNVFGPGVGFIVHTDLTGPFPSDWTWRVDIVAHGGEGDSGVVMTAPLWAVDQHERRIWIDGDPDGGQTTSYGRYIAFETGQSIDVNIQLLESDGVTAADSGTISAATWDTDSSGRGNLPVASGGLTTEQATQLAELHALAVPGFTTADGTPLPTTPGDLVRHAAARFFGIDTTVHTLTGSGTIIIPSLLGLPTAWGIVMDVTSAPSGWGRKPGYVDSFNFRIAQFLLLQPAVNPEGYMVIKEHRLHLEHETWLWDDVWATTLAYYIDPPCEVQVRFVTAFSP